MALKEIINLTEREKIHKAYTSPAASRFDRFMLRVSHPIFTGSKSLREFYGKQIGDINDELKNHKMAVILLGNTVHDKKNIFASIKMPILQVLNDPNVPEVVKAALKPAYATAKNEAESTVDEVEFAKLVNGDAKKVPDPLLPANLDEMIHSKVNRYLDANSHRKYDVSTVVRLNKNVQEYYLIGGRVLGQILDNFISNAFKYTGEENGLVSVRLEDKGSHLLFTVDDNGEGITQEHLHNHSNESVSKKKDGSTQYGLHSSIVLCEAFNWNLHFESENGKGTTVHLKLPLSEKPAQPPAQQ